MVIKEIYTAEDGRKFTSIDEKNMYEPMSGFLADFPDFLSEYLGKAYLSDFELIDTYPEMRFKSTLNIPVGHLKKSDKVITVICYADVEKASKLENTEEAIRFEIVREEREEKGTASWFRKLYKMLFSFLDCQPVLVEGETFCRICENSNIETAVFNSFRELFFACLYNQPVRVETAREAFLKLCNNNSGVPIIIKNKFEECFKYNIFKDFVKEERF